MIQPVTTKHFVFREAKMPKIAQHNGLKYSGGQWWYVELHLGDFGLYGPAALGVIHNGNFSDLFVNDCVRHRGYGTDVIEAAVKRFGTLTWCDTTQSRPFHESLVAKGIARVTSYGGSNWYESIPLKRRALYQRVLKRFGPIKIYKGRSLDDCLTPGEQLLVRTVDVSGDKHYVPVNEADLILYLRWSHGLTVVQATEVARREFHEREPHTAPVVVGNTRAA